MTPVRLLAATLSMPMLLNAYLLHAQALPEAEIGIKIVLAVKPSTRPMTVAFVPQFQRYYVADGGLGPVPGDMENSSSKSMVHAFDSAGNYLQSASPGYDNRSLYYNTNSYQLETITYNVSSDAGFAPNTGIFALELDEKGDLKTTSQDVFGFNPAFGDAATMPSYNADAKVYYAKQERSNKVWVVQLPQREKISEIDLDLAAAGAQSSDIGDHFVAYTGINGEELAVLDVDHKAVLLFDLRGKFVGKSLLPKNMKLYAQNHFNGTGYARGMFFVYYEREGEFGTYYGFKVSDLAH